MAFRSAATTTGSLPFTATKPTGTVSGDVVVAVMSNDNSGGTLTFPSGWTQVRALDSITNGDTQVLSWGWIIATGSESYAFSGNGGDTSISVATYSGRSGTPIDVTPSVNNPNSASLPTSPVSIVANGITTVTNGDDLVMLMGVDSSNGNKGAYVGSGSMTVRTSTATNIFATTAIADFNQSTAGATGNQTTVWTAAGDSGNFIGYLVALAPSGGGGSSANLTAQTATFSEGTLGVSITKALTGQTASFAQGTLAGAVSHALTGQTATFTEGALSPAVSYGLTACTATFTEGTMTPSTGGDVTIALSGLTATFSEGTLTPNVSYGVTGQSASFTEGTLSAGVSYGMSSQTATFTQGSLTASWSGSAALSAITATFTQGALIPVVSMALSGQSATFTEGSLGNGIDTGVSALTASFTEGTLTPSQSGNITIALSGLTATFTPGIMIPSGGDVIAPLEVPAGRPRRQERFIVRVDGREFVCRSLEQVNELLAKLKDLAKQHAQALVERKPGSKPIKVGLPKISGPPEALGAIEATRIELKTIYDDTFRDAEIRMLMELSQKIEEDNDILWMLL